MKIKRFLFTLITLFLPSSFLLSCSNGTTNINPKEFITKEYIDFTKGEPNSLVISASDNYSNEGVFGCTWSKDNIYYEEGANFLLSKEDDNYYGAELKTLGSDGLFLGGYFSTTLKPSNIRGTASTFFLYIDDPHDEIDIEFLGKDTTKVQFNYFSNDVGGHEYWYDLGFDASKEFHTYGFYWDFSRIIWFVDNVPVYEANKDIPTNMMRIYANFWCGAKDRLDILGWIGKINDDDLPAISTYKNINYADLDGKGRIIPDNKDPGYDEDNIVSLFELGFNSTANYIVTKKDDSYDVTFNQNEGMYHYLAPNGFSKLEFGDPKYSTIKVKNNSDFAYEFCLSYYDDIGEYVALNGEAISENGTSSLKRKGSTCIYFILGALDKAEFKVTFIEGVNKFSKMNIMCAPNTNTTGEFSILDWFVYDLEPVDNPKEDETRIDLLENGFSGSYSTVKTDEGYDVSFSQSKGAFRNLKVNNVDNIKFDNLDNSVIKVKNLVDFGYEFTLTFKDNDNNYVTTGGYLKSSTNESSSYIKHGSTAEYFLLGANDTAEFEITLKNGITSLKSIEIIIAPKTEVDISGQFRIIEWYIAYN